MPTNSRNQLLWNFTGNPATVNETTAYAPGCLGDLITIGGKTYQYVQLDSGATSTAAIAAAAGQITTWKDKATYLVTNDLRFSQAGRNAPAGMVCNAATAGNYIFVQKGGLAYGSGLKATSSPAAGDLASVNSGTAADCAVSTAGTFPSYLPVARYLGASVNSLAPADLLLVGADG